MSLTSHWFSWDSVVRLTGVAYVKPKFVLDLPCRLYTAARIARGGEGGACAAVSERPRTANVMWGPKGGRVGIHIERIPRKQIEIPEFTP